MGTTNPANAEDGTIRKAYGLSVEENSVHGSDSKKMQKLRLVFSFRTRKFF